VKSVVFYNYLSYKGIFLWFSSILITYSSIYRFW